MSKLKILLVYPNLSMMMAPPVSYGIFTRILKNEGYLVDIFDCTPYIGEGASVDESREFSIDSKDETEVDASFQSSTTEEQMSDMVQSRPFSYAEDLGIHSKTGLYDDFTSKVNEFNPDLLLVSIVEDTFHQALGLISLVEKKNIQILCGGVFITAAPELAMSYPQIQMIGIGEGEQVILDVASSIDKGLSCENTI